MIYRRGRCLACGDVWEDPEGPVICPECESLDVIEEPRPELEAPERLPLRCPGCGLMMTHREAAELGACSDCAPAFDPDGIEYR